ncbi:MAG: YwaF family protein, partial [Clostridia bacterium]|nr:YwaF family protein [Clostridia bacterium]
MTLTWGTFGVTHLLSLALAILLNVGLYFLLKRRSRRVQLAVLGVLSFSGIAAILFNLLMWGSPLEYLPFHLCSLSAMLLPIAVLTRKRIPCNLLLLWSLGAFVALVLNYSVAEAEILSPTFFFYYFPHALECGIPILLFKLGLSELSPRCILPTVGITLTAYTA